MGFPVKYRYRIANLYQDFKEDYFVSYVLSCCSMADMSAAYYKERNIEWIPFHYVIDGVSHLDDQSVPIKSFYDAMRNGAMTSTAQISTGEFIEYFTSFLEKGLDVLHINLSTGLSGVYNAACIARDDLVSKYPDRKLIVVDSLAASSGYGLVMDTLADMRDAGKSIDELAAWIEEHKLEMRHWFFSTDLTFFIRGGRVTKTAGFFGSMLHICPLLDVDGQGKLQPREKLRGKKAVIRRIVEKMELTAANGLDYDGKCFISQSDCMDDARAVADLIEERFKKLNGKVVISDIGTGIGSHTGPGTVALFFWGKSRKGE